MGTYLISKKFTFSAAHMLSGLPDDHQCSRLHGHNYTVCVELAAQDLIKPGFIRDYGDLDTFKAYLDAYFEHRYLGAMRLVPRDYEYVIDPVVEFNPTAENLAEHFYGVLRAHLGFREVVRVGVSETEKTWAWYDSEEIV